MYRLTFRLLCNCSAALFITGCAAEAETPAALELTGRVVDAADILSPAFEEAISVRLEQLETRTQVELVVVTTPDLQGHDVAAYSFELANSWGIGSAERDDGVMLLVAPSERKVRIEVGYGLEASVRDEDAAKIIREAILPHFRQSDYEAGIDAGVDHLIDEVTPFELKEAA